MTALHATLPLPRAAIFAPSGPVLSEEEIVFFNETLPAGFILMKRNCETHDQLLFLINNLKHINPKALILIDEEGGRVSRLTPHIYKERPAQGMLQDIDEAQEHGSITGERLANLGINVACAPVVDLLFEGAHHIIGDRSFGGDATYVSDMGKAFCFGLHYHGVASILKHIPGHGRAAVDSHEKLPYVDASQDELMTTDFAPFINLAKHSPMAMVAHVIYSAFDAELPASLSPTMVRVIRETIGFEGVLMTDGLEMKALAPRTMGERAKQAIDAGIDLILHCTGNMDEMRDVAINVPPINTRVQKMIETYF